MLEFNHILKVNWVLEGAYFFFINYSFSCKTFIEHLHAKPCIKCREEQSEKDPRPNVETIIFSNRCFREQQYRTINFTWEKLSLWKPSHDNYNLFWKIYKQVIQKYP